MNLRTKLNRITSAALAALMLTGSMAALPVSAADTSVSIAEFKYTSPGTSGTDLADTDSKYGDKDSGYTATGGMLQTSARLFASVTGTSNKELEWSKAEYTYNGASKSAIVPIMAADSDNNWGTAPYFKLECSTAGYDNITFSAKVNGTKKGPANYKLQYSTDGTSYTDVKTAPTIASTQNKDLSSNLFDNVSIPAAADKSKVYFRIIATDTVSIGGPLLSAYPDKGEAAINDVVISGTPKASTPKLPAPSSNIASGTDIYSDTAITLSSAVSGAVIKYTVNGGAAQVYTEPLTPFINYSGSSVTITAWAELDGYEASDVSTFTYTCSKDNITSFNFTDRSDIKYINGSVRATSGVYPTGKITASLDGINRFVPLYDDENGASAAMAPDDTYTWEQGGYWQFEISTLGYSDVFLSMDAYSSNKGPASMTLKYSTDGQNFTDIEKNRILSVTSFGEYFSKYALPSAAGNKDKVYIRLVMEEDKRAKTTDTAALFGNESKGNTYINNIVFSGNRTSALKAPYTTKKTDYFGLNGTIAYTSPDGAGMKYSIYDKLGNAVVENAVYNETEKISLASLPQFSADYNNKFRVDIWAENGSEKSAVNSKTYTYKGDIITSFEFDETSEISGTSVLSGSSELSMYPDGQTAAELSYNILSESLRASASLDNPWTFDIDRTDASEDGYWLIKTSTKGYKNLIFTAEQVSTEKGPRDFCISYSTDGVNYTTLPNSNVKVTENLDSTYGNITLPSELDDKETVYIKIKIDGGETVYGVELTDALVLGSGHTGINNIELCGEKILGSTLSLNTEDTVLAKGSSYPISFSSTASNPTVIVALYNNGTLISCDLSTDEVVIPADTNATDVTVMLWNGMNTLLPLTSPVSKKIR